MRKVTKRFLSLALVLLMILSAVPIGAVAADEMAGEIVVYAGKDGTRGSKGDSFTCYPEETSLDWNERASKWVWSGTQAGCDQFPLYTSMVGATFTFNLGTVSAGQYRLYYFGIPNSSVMALDTKEGDVAVATVTMPAIASTATADWVDLGEVTLNGTGDFTVNYTKTDSTDNCRATAVKLTPVTDSGDGDGGAEEETAEPVVIYAASAPATTAISGNFSCTPAELGADWNTQNTLWSWSTSVGVDDESVDDTTLNNEKADDYYTLNTRFGGASCTFTAPKEQLQAGNYEVYYYVYAQKDAGTAAMDFVVKDGDIDIGTVGVPETLMTGTDDKVKEWASAGYITVSGENDVTLTYTRPNDEKSNSRATAVKLVPYSGEIPDPTVGIVAYASKPDAYELSENVTALSPNGLNGTISSNWQDAANQWTWTTNGKYIVDTNYRPLYTGKAGASVELTLKDVPAGTYEFQYYTIQTDVAISSAMELAVKDSGENETTVNVPAVGKSEAGSAVVAGFTKVSVIVVETAGDVTVTYTAPEGVTDARFTAVKLVPTEEEPLGDPISDEVIVHATDDAASFSSGWGDSVSNLGGLVKPKWCNSVGETFSYRMGYMAAGSYEVSYYMITAASVKMELEVKDDGETVNTLTVPTMSTDGTAGWVTLGTISLDEASVVTVDHTTPGGNHSRATSIRLTPVSQAADTDAEGVVIKNATVAADCEKSEEPAWSNSGLKNYNDGGTIYCQYADATLTFNTDGISAGNYKMYYWVVPHDTNLEKMTFTVTHNGVATEISAPIHENAIAGWYYMGTLDFAGSNEVAEEFVFTHPGTDAYGNQARGTAIMLVPTDQQTYFPPQEIEEEVIDVDPYPGFSFVGDWGTSSALTGPMTKSQYSMWINQERIAASQGDLQIPANNYCQYKPDLSVTAGVDVYVYELYWHENQADSIIYEVHHNGQIDRIESDLTKLTRSGWLKLGTFDFSGPEETNFVRIVCTDAYNYEEKTNFRASTVKFDVVNDAASGGIWQTVYVTPSPVAEVYQVADLDKLEDVVDDAPYKYEVEYMFNEGVVSGPTDTTYEPEKLITEADFVTYVSNLLGLTEQNAALTAGVPAGSETTLTKEEAALILYNAIALQNKETSWLKNFSADYVLAEGKTVSQWATTAVDTLYGIGVVFGTDGTLDPQEELTRGNAAVMLKHYAQQIVWASPVQDNAADEWVLTFSEEFDGDTLNTHVWTAADENPAHILSSRHPENVVVHDGALHLLTKYESKVDGKYWTTGNVLGNAGAFTQAYGYWECRYKFTAHAGINNSFWMMTNNSPQDDTWYEIDVCEGHYVNKMNTNLHEFASTGEQTQHSQTYRSQYDLSADYHTYAVQWTPEYLYYYFDGELIHTKNNPLNTEKDPEQAFARLSSAVLSWAGAITQKADGTAQVVDYVRVWQRKSDMEDHTTINEYQHTMVPVEAKPATCTEDGYVAHYQCSVCYARYADEAGTVLKNGGKIPATGHEETEVVGAKEASCTEDGYTGDTYCECGEKIGDGETIPATGEHNYIPGEYVWNADYTACTVVGTCGCGDTAEATATVTSEQTKAPTTTTLGETTYTAIFKESWAEPQTKTLADIPALNEVEVPEIEGGDVSIDNETPATKFLSPRTRTVPTLMNSPMVM